MTLEAQVLTDSAVRAADGGCEVDVRLPWYRSLPMSCLEDVELIVNGEAVARDDVRVRLDGADLALDDLAERTTDFWFVQDAVTVSAPLAGGLVAGADADVQVTLATRIPYILIGPDAALVQRTRVARKVVVR